MSAEERPTTRERRFVKQPVRSDDPSLSREANEMLTRELQQVVGATEVQVPEGTLERRVLSHGGHSTMTATLVDNRPIILVTFLGAIVVGSIIALATGQFWALLLAVGIHAAATVLVAFGVLQLTTQTEHVSPEVHARLEAEGVTDPDQVFNELIEDFSGARTARGATEIVSGGFNETTRMDPTGRAVEQRTEMTPTSEVARPAGSGSAIERGLLVAFVCILAATIVFAVINGGQMWILPVVVLPMGLGWIYLDHLLGGGPAEERAAAQGRRHEPAAAQRPAGDVRQALVTRVLPLALGVAAAVVVFVLLIVGVVADRL